MLVVSCAQPVDTKIPVSYTHLDVYKRQQSGGLRFEIKKQDGEAAAQKEI